MLWFEKQLSSQKSYFWHVILNSCITAWRYFKTYFYVSRKYCSIVAKSGSWHLLFINRDFSTEFFFVHNIIKTSKKKRNQPSFDLRYYLIGTASQMFLSWPMRLRWSVKVIFGPEVEFVSTTYILVLLDAWTWFTIHLLELLNNSEYSFFENSIIRRKSMFLYLKDN